jgi:hypothetical protein
MAVRFFLRLYLIFCKAREGRLADVYVPELGHLALGFIAILLDNCYTTKGSDFIDL